MKIKVLLAAALISAAAVSANAGVRFGVSFAVPVPVPVVVARPVVYAPAYPVVYAPAAPVAVAPVPACPGVDYVWSPGYWANCPGGRAWVGGSWCYRPVHGGRGHFDGGHRR